MDRSAPQMLCASCWRAGSPDTWIPGSDRLELVAWSCLGVPGLLYCLWRHLARAKICRHCGSQDLIREARASRRPARLERRVQGLRSAGACAWPPPLRAPRARLRRGAPLAGAGFGAAILALLTGLQAAPLAPVLGAWLAIWICVQVGLGAEAGSPCLAWDERGRALSVEMLA